MARIRSSRSGMRRTMAGMVVDGGLVVEWAVVGRVRKPEARSLKSESNGEEEMTKGGLVIGAWIGLGFGAWGLGCGGFFSAGLGVWVSGKTRFFQMMHLVAFCCIAWEAEPAGVGGAYLVLKERLGSLWTAGLWGQRAGL